MSLVEIMRLKANSNVSKEWICFFCLHVRTATIFLGIWHAVLQLLAFSFIGIMMRERKRLHTYRKSYDVADYMDQIPGGLFNVDEDVVEGLPTPLSKIDSAPFPVTLRRQHEYDLYYPEVDMSAMFTMFTLTITLSLIYGAVKGRPTYLLPFFCMQLFDYVITALTSLGYVCYMRSMHRLIAESWHLPFRRFLLQLNLEGLTAVVLLGFMAVMTLKGYCIVVVWHCYKYLTIRQNSMRNAIHYIVPGNILLEQTMVSVDPEFGSSSLPDYEAACKMTPPPSYAAVAGMHGLTEEAYVSQNLSQETPTAGPSVTTTAHLEYNEPSASTEHTSEIALERRSSTNVVPPVEQTN